MSTSKNKSYQHAPENTLSKEKKYNAKLKTSQGDIIIKLFTDTAPVTVNNFVFLAKEGFYNDTIFHRVIPDFVIQGGDPEGTGMGGPGYTFQDEFAPSSPRMLTGTLAMANAGPATNGSQFFICLADLPFLEGKHTVFGTVSEGMEVVFTIASIDTDYSDKPLTDVIITSIEITEE